MVSPITITISSLKVEKFLEKYNTDTLNKINNATHNAGFQVEGEVKNSMAGRSAEPRSFDTGNMTQKVTTDNSQKFISRVYGGAKYTIFLEEGTRFINGRHHFGNSLIRLKPTIVKKMSDATKV